MKNYKIYIGGGGVFSRFLQCGIEPLADLDFDNVYLVPSDFYLDDPNGEAGLREIIISEYNKARSYGIKNPYEPLLNYVLYQSHDSTYQDWKFLSVGPLYTSANKIEESSRFNDYKHTLSKIFIRNDIRNEVRSRGQHINWDRTLGVHVRLTTIIRHSHDDANFQSYVDAINLELANNSYDHIFVACDNNYSLAKLKEIYGNMLVANQEFQRIDGETNDGFWEFHHYFKEFYWREAFVDCLMLSQAKTLICRTSNFSNAAILFGNYSDIRRL